CEALCLMNNVLLRGCVVCCYAISHTPHTHTPHTHTHTHTHTPHTHTHTPVQTKESCNSCAATSALPDPKTTAHISSCALMHTLRHTTSHSPTQCSIDPKLHTHTHTHNIEALVVVSN